MRINLTVLFLLLVATVANGKNILLKTDKAKPGRYYLVVDIAEDGSVDVKRLYLEEILLENGTPQPDPDEPDPSVDFEKVSRNLITSIEDPDKENVKKLLYEVYNGQVKLIDNGGIRTTEELKQAGQLGFSLALSPANKVQLWQPWINGINKALQSLNGEPMTEWRKAWVQIAKSLQN